jgi:hypothetical protein
MRLTAAQLELLRESAQLPGRRSPTHEEAASVPASAVDASEDVKRALMDAYWAIAGDRPPRMAPDEPGTSVQTGAQAVNDGWRPIATAPALRDVEIRTADILGSYALLYPCRYVPEQGWINAILLTPLTVQPVEWREWVQEYPPSRDP